MITELQIRETGNSNPLKESGDIVDEENEFLDSSSQSSEAYYAQQVAIHNTSFRTLHELYGPLNLETQEIRILVVKAGMHDEALSCSLLHLPLAHAKQCQYDTVSYCWGTEVTTLDIHGIMLEIPTSAKQAIHRFRYPDRDRNLWIDSICLHQANDEEKSYQVARMHNIYKIGRQNLIWLGEDNGTGLDAFRSSNEILDRLRSEKYDFATYQDITSSSSKGRQLVETNPFVDIDLDAIMQLFSRPWFNRLWVIQEAILSTESVVFYGRFFCLSLAQFARLARWMYFLRCFLPDRIRDSRKLMQVALLFDFFSTGSERSIYLHKCNADKWRNLLIHTRWHETRDTRDHVFALLGMYQESTGTSTLPKELTPDYTRSATDVLRDATKYALLGSASLQLLGHIRHGGGKATGPSWVLLPGGSPWPAREICLASFFRSNDHEARCFPDPHDPDILLAQGFLVDGPLECHVKKLSSTLRNIDGESVVAFLRESLWLVGADTLENPLLAEVFCCGRNADGEPVTSNDLREFLSFLALRTNPERRTVGLVNFKDMIKANAPSYERMLTLSAVCRKFFITGSGRFGLGPLSMESGDKVVVLYGCRWPCVLRHHAGVDEYEFIGACYVQGIMYGAAVEQHQIKGWEDVSFTIR